jgi:hypothetical protein
MLVSATKQRGCEDTIRRLLDTASDPLPNRLTHVVCPLTDRTVIIAALLLEAVDVRRCCPRMPHARGLRFECVVLSKRLTMSRHGLFVAD